MVQFLTPAALALLAVSIPILLLWMLKMRRRDVTIASTMLWSELLRDREANTPWQRLRRNLLLLLQLATLVGLVLALARPFMPVPAVATGAVVVLLDASASMNATDVDPSRFAVARQAAVKMIEGLGRGGLMTVIAVGSQPRVLAASTADRAVLREAVAAARPEKGRADWASAFALASGATSGAAESTIVIISDGIDLTMVADLPRLPGEVRYLPVGKAARSGGTENLAITTLAARDGRNGLELLIRIANTGPPTSSAIQSLLSIYVDGALYDSRHITVPPGEDLSLTYAGDFGLPAGAATIEARLMSKDALALDDVAWAVGRPGGERRALVVSAGNLFLERAIATLPDVAAFRARPDAALPAEPYDLYVFDGVLPDRLPEGPMLIIDPPPGNSLLTVSGAFSDTRISQVADHQLLTHVDLSQVQISEAKRVEMPDWPGTHELVQARGGPLLLVGEPAGRRVAVLTFDLHRSDLPLLVAFPVLMANLVDWLTPGLPFDVGGQGSLHPGASLTLHPVGAAEVRITRPDGTVWTAEAGESPLVFAETEQLGLYQVELDGRPAGQFAVNLFSLAESTLTRQEAITLGRARVTPGGEEELGQRELWPWLAALAFAILLVEWWVYHRGL